MVSNVINPAAASDPLSALLAQLSQPSETTTRTGSGSEQLKQIITQLQALSTPGGASDQIKQIFQIGTQKEMPAINANSVMGTGARAASSTYQALAINDLNARLAGQGAVLLNQNANAATQAAAALSQTDSTTRLTKQPQNIGTAIAAPLLGIAGAAVTKPLVDYSVNKVKKYLNDNSGIQSPGVGAVDAVAKANSFINPSVATTASEAVSGANTIANNVEMPTDFISTLMNGGNVAGGGFDTFATGASLMNDASTVADATSLFNSGFDFVSAANDIGTAATATSAAMTASDAVAAANVMDYGPGVDVLSDAGTFFSDIGSNFLDEIPGASYVKDLVGCFITTAAVEYKGLPDNCYVLQTLRRFRDSWMQDNHAEAVRQYYAEAPAIVTALKAREDAPKIFAELYGKHIIPAVVAIEHRNYIAAYMIYKNMFEFAKSLATAA